MATDIQQSFVARSSGHKFTSEGSVRAQIEDLRKMWTDNTKDEAS
jgi:hypothetical protein